LIAPTSLVTVPVPAPALFTVSVRGTGAPLNCALTVVAAVTVTVHGLVVQPPPEKPPKVEPPAGVAVKVTVPPG
jgi:hypothetical protein